MDAAAVGMASEEWGEAVALALVMKTPVTKRRFKTSFARAYDLRGTRGAFVSLMNCPTTKQPSCSEESSSGSNNCTVSALADQRGRLLLETERSDLRLLAD